MTNQPDKELFCILYLINIITTTKRYIEQVKKSTLYVPQIIDKEVSQEAGLTNQPGKELLKSSQQVFLHIVLDSYHEKN